MEKQLPLFPAKDYEIKKRRLGWRGRFALGAIALSLSGTGGFLGYEYLGRSGEHTVYPAARPQQEFIDNTMEMLDWNAEDTPLTLVAQIKRFNRQRTPGNPDVIAIQEVNTDDAELLQYAFPHWNIVYGLADTKQQILEGGYGDILMTRQEPRDVESVSLKGSPTLGYATATVTGIGLDLAEGVIHQDFNFDNTSDRENENREALAMTIKVRKDNKLIDARVITTHIGAGEENNEEKNKLHREQFIGLLDFIKRNKKPGRPLFVCGDLNDLQGNVIPALNHIGLTVREPKEPTSLNNPIAIDFCASDEAGYAKEEVLNYKGSDHAPKVDAWNMDDPSVNFPYQEPNGYGQPESKGL